MAATFALVIQLVAGAWPTPAFGATPIGEMEGDPGDRIELSFRNEFRAGNHTWDTHAPDGLTFLEAPVWTENTGARHECELVSPTYARCQPAHSNWRRGNTLTAILRINPQAQPGPTTGLNTLGRERARFTIMVLPHAPTLSVAGQSVTTDRVIDLTGTRRTRDSNPAGPSPHSVRVHDSSGRTVCTVPAGHTPQWRCTTDELPLGETTLTATQISPAGATSRPSRPVTVRVIDTITINAPGNGSTTDRTPAITGGAAPGSTVTVLIAGRQYAATAAPDGSWSVVPDPLPYGRHRISVHALVHGARFDAEPATVTIIPPPVELISPAEGSSTVGGTVTVVGAAEPGADVEVSVDSREKTISSGGDGRFHATFADLPAGTHRIEVTQTIGGARSAAVSRRFVLRRVPAPTITTPTSGATVTETRPTIAGSAHPNARLQVVFAGRTSTVVADASGRWRFRPDKESTGRQQMIVRQIVAGVTSPPAVLIIRIDAGTASSAPQASSPSTADPPPERAAGQPAGGKRRAEPPPTPPRTPRRDPDVEMTTGQAHQADRPPPAASPTARPPASPSAGPSSAAAQVNGGGGESAGERAADGVRPILPLTLEFAGDRMVPGQVALMSGSIGPNHTGRALPVTVSGRLTRGALYRTVAVTDGRCEVSRLTFRCLATLPPGRAATLTIRVLPDALNAPDRVVQQIAISTEDAASNAMTSVVRVDGRRTSDTEQLADKISGFPGSTVVTLSIFLFALAATATKRRHRIPQVPRR